MSNASRTPLVRAVEALQSGDVEGALRQARSILKKRPGDGAAQLVQGRALLAGERIEEARKALERAVRLLPTSAEAIASLARAQAALGLVREPYEGFVRALELAPGAVHIRVWAAGFLADLGELDEAEGLYRAAAAEGNADAVAGLARIAARSGRPGEALALLEGCPDLLEASADLALTHARLCLQEGRLEEAVDRTRELAARSLPDGARVPVLHLLGDALEATGDHGGAFAAWKEANGLRGLSFDGDAHRSAVDRLLSETARGPLVGGVSSGLDSDLPVLIVGLPRSGTTLLERMLAAHPSVATAGELDDLVDLAGRADPRSGDSLTRAGSGYLDRLRGHVPGDRAAERIVDKMPSNVFALHHAARMVPRARAILCTRDAADVALSCFAKNLHGSHPWATDLDALAEYIAQFERVREHWRAHPPLPLLEVAYAELVTSPGPTLLRVLAFLGLEWDDSVLRFHESRAAVATASWAEVQRPVHTGSVGRSARFEAGMAPFVRALAEARRRAGTRREEAPA